MGNCCRPHKSIDEEPEPLLEHEEPEPLLDKEHLLDLMHKGAIRRVRAAVEAAARDTSCTASLYAPDKIERTLLQQAVREVTKEPDLIRCKIDGKYLRLLLDIGYLGSSCDICYTPPPVYKQ